LDGRSRVAQLARHRRRAGGALTLPPANATPGCELAQATVFVTQEAGTCGAGAGQVECPDLFVDDVSITLAP
jgi:hypothetical protein